MDFEVRCKASICQTVVPISSGCKLQCLSDIGIIGLFGGFVHKKTFGGLAVFARCGSLLHSSRQDFKDHKDMGLERKRGAGDR